jgi:hypothetical protein
MKRLLIGISLIAASPAFGQQQATALDRVSVSLGQCIGNFERKVDEIAELQKQLAAAQVRIKELEKPEEKKE